MLDMSKILIVEDEQALQRAISLALTNEGFNVFTAKDGEEGLRVALKEKPDLILLDVIMPVMDGMSMLHKLREDESWGKDAKVLILTNLSDDKKISDIAEEKSVSFLVKSNCSLVEIVSEVKKNVEEE